MPEAKPFGYLYPDERQRADDEINLLKAKIDRLEKENAILRTQALLVSFGGSEDDVL